MNRGPNQRKPYWLLCALLPALGCSEGPPGPGGQGGPVLPASVRVSGILTYDSVPVTAAGLAYSATLSRPARGIEVDAIDPDTAQVISVGTAVTDDNGAYSVAVLQNRRAMIRFRSRLALTGWVSWQASVVDEGGGLYSALGFPLETGFTNRTGVNRHLGSGWTGATYGASREAAPFAILDSLYGMARAIRTADTLGRAASLPALLIQWTPMQAGPADYISAQRTIRLAGLAGTDTDEYDHAVIGRQFAKFLFSAVSRDDSVGGVFQFSDRLDARVAYSEGMALAVSSALSGESVQRDTFGPGQSQVRTFDVAASGAFEVTEGWYSAPSVAFVTHQLLSSGALSLSGLWMVLTEDLRQAPSFTTVYSLARAIRQRFPSAGGALNSALQGESISTTTSEFDTPYTETNDGGDIHTLPVYYRVDVRNTPFTGDPATQNPIEGPYVHICSDGDNGAFNRLRNRGFFFFTVATAREYQIRSDPDARDAGNGLQKIRIYRQGQLVAQSPDLDPDDPSLYGKIGTMVAFLQPGTYVGELSDINVVNARAASRRCFWISVILN